ncbi:hypothetical protein D9M68_351810 [compost metagenome]
MRAQDGAVQSPDGDCFPAGQAQGLAVIAVLELQGQYAHAHQVGAVDAFEAFSDHRLDPQQVGALGRPVAGRPGAVFLAGHYHQWRAFGLVAHGGVVDRQFLAAGHMQGVAAFLTAEHLVTDADIGEGAAHHHFVVATSRAIGVEVRGGHAVFAQVASGRAVGLDVAGGRDVVGGHRVPEQGEDARLAHVFHPRRGAGDISEEGWVLDVGGVRLPGVGVGLRHLY